MRGAEHRSSALAGPLLSLPLPPSLPLSLLPLSLPPSLPLLLALALALLLAAGGAEARQRPMVRMAYTPDVNEWTDSGLLEGTTRSLLDVVAKRIKVTYSFRAAPSEASMVAQLKSGAVNVAWLSGWEYARLSEQLKLAPIVGAQVNGRSTYRLLLLVRRSAQLTSLAALRGKRLSYTRGSGTPRPYLEVLVGAQTPREPERFFGQVVERAKPQAPILDVMLGEADACLVLDWTLAVTAQLNPQVQRDLVALQSSEPLALFALAAQAADKELFAAPGRAADKQLFAEMRRAGASLHQTAEGRELLLIFRVERLVPAQDSDFASLRRLLAAHRRLQKRDGR